MCTTARVRPLLLALPAALAVTRLPVTPCVFVNVLTRRTSLHRAENLAAVRLSAYNDLSKHVQMILDVVTLRPLRLSRLFLLVRLGKNFKIVRGNGAACRFPLQRLADNSVRQPR
jgi:hypothetical protein